MASIQITESELIVHMHGWDRVWAMRRSVRIPLAHVRSVRAKPEEAYFDDVIVDSWRGVGTYIPHRLAAGVVHLSDGPSFYAVRDPMRAIAIDVDDEKVRHVVVQMDDETPEDAAGRIEDALHSRAAV
jgi:hypothetical protein